MPGGGREARVGIIVGLASEANSLTKAGTIESRNVVVSGANPERAENGARGLIREGCEALVSLGLGGGLDDRLRPGDAVVASAIAHPDGLVTETLRDWRQSILALLGSVEGPVRDGVIAGSDVAVPGIDQKAALASKAGALVVDMESHRVARAAEASGVPMMAVRIVADPADRHVPDWVMGAIDEQGGVRGWMIVANLMLRPWQIGGLLKLASDSEIALQRLGGVARRAGPGFGFPL